MRPGSEAAFPRTGDTYQRGLTRRQWYAGKTLAGFCANPKYDYASEGVLAKMAFRQADAMIKAEE